LKKARRRKRKLQNKNWLRKYSRKKFRTIKLKKMLRRMMSGSERRLSRLQRTKT